MSLLRTLCLRNRVTGFFVSRESEFDTVTKDDAERRGQFAGGLALLIDVNLLEERLVEPTTHVVRRSPIGLVATLDEFHRQFEVAVNVREADSRGSEPLVDGRELARDSLLFIGVQFRGDDPIPLLASPCLGACWMTDPKCGSKFAAGKSPMEV